MLLQIDASSAKPVYQQIVDQVKYAIASGRLNEGDRLDPIREVAVQLRVNRNTIARAYMDLEREGLIRTRAGQGSFISSEATAVARARARKLLAEQLDELLARAHQFRTSEEDLRALFEERMQRVQLISKSEKPKEER